MAQATEFDPEAVRQGATLRALREANGWTQGRFAAALGYQNHSYLASVEAGRKRLTPVLASRVATLLGVPRAALVRPDEFEGAA